MLKNTNNAVVKRMARHSLKTGRRRTATLFLAVFLSSFMIFTIFTVGVTYFKMLKIQNIRMSGAKFDALIYGVTDEQAQKCENNPDITLTGFLGICGWIEKTDRDDTPSVGLGWADENYWSKMMKPAREKLEGEYPVAEDEIMVTREALEECGYDELGVGDSITVTYGVYDGVQKGTFRISGIWDGYGTKKMFYMSKAFYEKSGWKRSDAASGRYFMDFRQRLMTKKTQNAFIKSMKLGKQQALFFVSDLGESVEILGGLIGLIFVTCLCAYLLIYNIMYLSVAGRVRHYGLLQTIGMTERQIKVMLKEQLLLIGSMGIGTGCVMGAFVSFFLIPVIVKNLGIQSGYVDGIGVQFHPAVLVVTVLLAGITISLAGWKPVRKAAKVSPIEALGYRPGAGMKVSRRKGTGIRSGRKAARGNVIARISWEQFVKDKKRTAMVLVSLAMSLSVYLCVVTLISSQAARTIVSNSMNTDLVIKNDTGIKEKAKDRKDILTGSIEKSISSNQGVAEMHSIVFSEITIPWEPDLMEKWMKEFYAKWMSIPYKKDRKEYKEHPENFGTSMLGIDEEEFDHLNQTLDTPVSKNDFLAGKVCIVYRNGVELADKDLIGKTVTCTLYRNLKKSKTFTVSGVTDDSYYTALLGYPPTLIVSDQVVKAFDAKAFILKTGIRYKKEYDRRTEEEILAILKKDANTRNFSWESKLEEADEMRKAQGNMPQIGMGIVLILAFIGTMNYMNTFVVNIQNRRTELSVMESIGMTQWQILKMLIREGILYAGGAWLVTMSVGMAAVYEIYQSMNYCQVAFCVPVVPLLGAALVTIIVCVVIPVAAWKRLSGQGSVIERIRGIE